MKLSFAVIALTLGLATTSLDAQDRRQREKKDDIPESARPPAGMCRIWLEDVPAAQQPAPTDCATAVKNRPAKGRVIFGDDYAKAKKGDSSKTRKPIAGFAPSKSRERKPPL